MAGVQISPERPPDLEDGSRVHRVPPLLLAGPTRAAYIVNHIARAAFIKHTFGGSRPQGPIKSF